MKKYYVVWRGTTPGIYENWEECALQVKGVKGAVYKSFKHRDEAERAFAAPPEQFVAKPGKAGKPSKPKAIMSGGLQNPPDYRHDTLLPLPPEVKAEAWAVDAACSGNPGRMEYRGVDLQTGAELFHFGPVFGTNNIGEFLAIVHGLALLKRQGLHRTIYSDSRNAQLWVRAGHCRTTLPRNAKTEQVHQLIARAEAWLAANEWSDTPLIKWRTEKWGEIPADFGRK